MERIENGIKETVIHAIFHLYGEQVSADLLLVQKTRREFSGDFTLIVFPLLKISRKSAEETADAIGHYCVSNNSYLKSYNAIKGFLNISVSQEYWFNFLFSELQREDYGTLPVSANSPKVMIEFSSPNTNKPLHLGHIRNNLLGFSISRITEACGNRVRKVNLVNDRGIHICKSMIAWKLFGNGETPGQSNMKGDHLVGKYYVEYEKVYRRQVSELIEKGADPEQAAEQAPILLQAREMLRKWEADDPETRELWERMNHWVYEGFNVTYKRLGVDFDKIYYESETYKLGKELVLKGLREGILVQKEDGSVWADLCNDGLDTKLLLRSDGTSVYMTQDVGTAHQRYAEFEFDQHIYVVGNEQNYHFQVLKLVLKKLGFDWADRLYHLSYGMVELPEGKMKSREGTVVDADDLLDEMEKTARQMSEELGKLEEYGEEQKEVIYRQIGLGALKYYILKVDPKKNMTFNPNESIDFNGNTGPFIQYSYARIQSVLRKASETGDRNIIMNLNDKEVYLIRMIYEFPEIISESASTLNPSLIANFLFDLSREFNQFYHDFSILSAESHELVVLRTHLAKAVGNVLKSGMGLLGIEVPERM
ncbi:MAG: arginine--tRNA ligase [Bacteroidales bacterium]|nr:arginine--tRNA ligase [Bacteroidales bacterium]